jgi:pimeloyl-ACP methyl ester carboxylesterase
MVVPKDKTNLSQKIFSDGFERMGRKNIIEWVSYLHSVINGSKTVKKLKEINKKCFFISGEYDSLFLDGAKDCARELCDGVIEIMDDCTHVCNADNVDLFNDKVLNFLEDAKS